MPVSLRSGSAHYQIEFRFRGIRYRRSSGTPSKRLVEALERKWRSQIHEGRVLPRLVELPPTRRPRIEPSVSDFTAGR